MWGKFRFLCVVMAALICTGCGGSQEDDAQKSGASGNSGDGGAIKSIRDRMDASEPE